MPFLCVWIIAKAQEGLYPRLLLLIPLTFIACLYIRVGVKNVPASQILLPRYDENSPEYYTNLERMQACLLFLIRIYDNLAYHGQHIPLTQTAYQIMLVGAIVLSGLLWYCGRWILLAAGLVILLNKTWIGAAAEAILQFALELLQTTVELIQRLSFRKRSQTQKEEMDISIYENQRWWANNGYTSQVSSLHENTKNSGLREKRKANNLFSQKAFAL